MLIKLKSDPSSFEKTCEPMTKCVDVLGNDAEEVYDSDICPGGWLLHNRVRHMTRKIWYSDGLGADQTCHLPFYGQPTVVYVVPE